MQAVVDFFTAHPSEVGETYAQHWLEAMTISGKMGLGALAAMVHAFCPGFFQTTASSLAHDVVSSVVARRRPDKVA